MTGELTVAGALLIGAVVGGAAGVLAAIRWADMEVGDLLPLAIVLACTAAGGIAGAVIGGLTL